MVSSSWIEDWNSIIRNVIFKDEELKRLMKIPDNTSIVTFIDKYFINVAYATNVLTNESVRVIYGNVFHKPTENPNVIRYELSFDIYVKNEDLHNADRDRLTMRTNLIANRLINLLTSKRYIHNYRFWVEGEGNVGTSTIGYTRYNVSFGYLKTY